MFNDIDPVLEKAEEKISELKEERDKLYEQKLECTELSQVFEDMESAHKDGGGHAVIVPLFGGIAMVPAVIKPGSHVFANLGTGLYSKTTPAGARTFLGCKISQLDERIEEKTAMINSLIKGRNDVAELSKLSDEMKKDGIVNICEDETTETVFKKDDSSDDEPMEDVTTAAAVAATAAMGKDDDMNSFFDSLIESENKWNEECKFKESMGIKVTEKDAKAAAEEAYALANEMSMINKKMSSMEIEEVKKMDGISEIVEKEDDIDSSGDFEMQNPKHEPMKFEPIPQPRRESDDILADGIMEKEPDEFIAAQPPSGIAPYLHFPDPFGKYQSGSEEIIENYAPGPAKRCPNGPPKIVKKKKN